MIAGLGFASADLDVLMAPALSAIVTASVNVGIQVRRRGRAPALPRDLGAALDGELDARAILDLDAAR